MSDTRFILFILFSYMEFVKISLYMTQYYKVRVK